MISVAIYGKGGIGKTTISCNVAVALGKIGYRVMVLGCDPKRDSARLICGSRLPSLLDRYDDWDSSRSLEEMGLVGTGSFGVKAIEVGGPRPGVGCAGKGLALSLDFLKSRQIFQNLDVVIFDILGDVVCGGFAVPITKGFADRAALVVSCEFSSLFAANNILRGMKNLGAPVVGLIFNNRSSSQGVSDVKRFANEVNLPIIGEIPFNGDLAESDRMSQTVSEMGIDGLATVFADLGQSLISQAPSVSYKPIDDDRIYDRRT